MTPALQRSSAWLADVVSQGANLLRIVYGVTLVQIKLCEAIGQAAASAQHKQTTSALFQCLRSPDRAQLCISVPRLSAGATSAGTNHVQGVSWPNITTF